MRHGVVLPGGLDLETIVAAGVEAEAAGWDGVFYWDGVVPGQRGYDPWVALAAIAARTTRVALGAVLVPLPWRKPWLVARALGSLDQLSNGRAILPVGLGAPSPTVRNEPSFAWVPKVGFEPTRLAAVDFESTASAVPPLRPGCGREDLNLHGE